MKKLVAHGSKLRTVFFLVTLFTFHFLSFPPAEAKVYIDITSPAAMKVPIAIFDFPGTSGKEISKVLRDDLVFTGLFTYVDKAAYIEPLSQPFNPANWTPLGVETVVKGTVSEDKNLTVSVRLYDVTDGKEVLNKEYQSEKSLIRPLAHTVANDIYHALTGQQGVFRTKIMFVGERAGAKDLYLADWDGHRSRKLGLKGSIILSPHWSSDGHRAIYSSERGRQWGIYLLDFQRMTEKRIFVAKGTNMAGDFFPNKDSFVFSSSKEGSPDIYTYNIGNGKLTRLTSSYGIEVSPAVSPDGDLIAFVSDRGGSPQIYVMRADGSEVRRVTFEGNYNTSPAWSPSGDRIAFSGRRGGKNQVCIVKPDGSGLTQLTDIGNNEDPSFSPDGRYLVFTSDRDHVKGVYTMRANGESQERVTPKDLKAFGPRWSPN